MVKNWINDKYVRRKYAPKGEHSPCEQLEIQRVNEAKNSKKKLSVDTKRSSSSSSGSSSSTKAKKIKKVESKPVTQKNDNESDGEGFSSDDDFKPSTSKSTKAPASNSSQLLSFNFSGEGVTTVSPTSSTPSVTDKQKTQQVNNKPTEPAKKEKKKSSSTTTKKKKKVKKDMKQLESDSSEANSPYDFILEDTPKPTKQKSNVGELTDFLDGLDHEAIPQKPLTIEDFEQQLKLNLQMEMISKPAPPTNVASSSSSVTTSVAPAAIENTEGRARSASLVSLGDIVHEDRFVHQHDSDDDSDNDNFDFSSGSDDELFSSSKKIVQKQSLPATSDEAPKKKKKKLVKKKKINGTDEKKKKKRAPKKDADE
jgi:hypothetical protein